MATTLSDTASSTSSAGELRLGAAVTLAQVWQAYVRNASGELRPSTLEAYRRAMDRQVLPVLGPLPLSELTRERVREFVAAELARGVSARTVKNAVSVLRAVLGGLVRGGVLASNPASIPRGSLPARRRAPRSLTGEELRTLLHATAGAPHADLVHFLALTGARLGEALALRWSDVDLEAGTAAIRRPLRLRRGGLPPVRLCFRTIDLAAPLVARLARLRADATEAGLVFDERAMLDGGGSAAQRLNAACRHLAGRAGLPVFDASVLRHTWAVLQLRAGVPIGYVSRSLGHASPSATAALYGSVGEAVRRDEAALAASARGIESLRKTLGEQARFVLGRSVAAGIAPPRAAL